MDQAIFDELQTTLATEGPVAALDRLCARLRDNKDYGSLFYALLMKKRQELGVAPVPAGSYHDLPKEMHAPFELAIREAGRIVGDLYIEQGDLPQAWVYFRMLGDSEPVNKAIERYQPGPEEDIQQLVNLAFYEGVHPRKGFDWILERFGLCNAITTLTGQELPQAPEVREYCIQRLVQELYQELKERIAAEIVRHDNAAPAVGSSVRELMAGRDWLFQDDSYHVDLSHLAAVVQMSINLSPGKELEMARELCAYGARLSPQYQGQTDPPFENLYQDYGVYLATLAGDHAEDGIAHFQAKADSADPQEVGTFPAEVLVNLLLRLNRPADALATARKYLAGVDSRRLSCPSIAELCQRANDYRTLAEVAREQGDAVHFLAGLLASR